MDRCVGKVGRTDVLDLKSRDFQTKTEDARCLNLKPGSSLSRVSWPACGPTSSNAQESRLTPLSPKRNPWRSHKPRQRSWHLFIWWRTTWIRITLRILLGRICAWRLIRTNLPTSSLDLIRDSGEPVGDALLLGGRDRHHAGCGLDRDVYVGASLNRDHVICSQKKTLSGKGSAVRSWAYLEEAGEGVMRRSSMGTFLGRCLSRSPCPRLPTRSRSPAEGARHVFASSKQRIGVHREGPRERKPRPPDRSLLGVLPYSLG